MFHTIAGLNDHIQRPQGGQIGQRVRRADDHIRALARLDGAGLAGNTRQRRIAQRGAVQRKRRRHAAVLHKVA